MFLCIFITTYLKELYIMHSHAEVCSVYHAYDNVKLQDLNVPWPPTFYNLWFWEKGRFDWLLHLGQVQL